MSDEVRVRQVAPATGGAVRDVFERENRLAGALSPDQCSRLVEITDRCLVSRTLSAGGGDRNKIGCGRPAGRRQSLTLRRLARGRRLTAIDVTKHMEHTDRRRIVETIKDGLGLTARRH